MVDRRKVEERGSEGGGVGKGRQEKGVGGEEGTEVSPKGKRAYC